MQSVRWAIHPPAHVDLGAILERWEAGGERRILIEHKRKRREVDLDEQILGLSRAEDGLELVLRVHGGARLREVFRGVVGVDPFAEPGWRATKRGVGFEPVPAIAGAVPEEFFGAQD